MLKTATLAYAILDEAYHLGEGRVLKTSAKSGSSQTSAYHLGEGRVLKTLEST